MDDKQFDDAFTTAGGWFILTQYEEIADYRGDKSDLVDSMLTKGFDSKKTVNREPEVQPATQKRSIMELQGLGKEIWQGMDAQ